MSKPKKPVLKIKSDDGDEFEVGDEVVKEMETLQTMTKYVDECEDDEEQIPTCALKGRSLKKVLVWTEWYNYFKEMDLKETFDTIISADYLSNHLLLEEMLKKVFLNYSNKVIDEEGSKFEDSTIICLINDFKRRNEVIVIFDNNKLSYYDPLTRQWTTITRIPKQIDKEICSKKKACVVKEKIYILGVGEWVDGVGEMTNIAEYNTQTNSWRTLRNASMKPCYGGYSSNTFSVAFLCSVVNKLYIRSTWNNYYREESYNTIEVLDLDQDDEDLDWGEIDKEPNYDDCAAEPSATVADNCIYIVGGEYDVTKYDVEEDKLTRVTELSSNLSNCDTSVAVLEGKIYVSDGYNFECYDTSNDTWTTLARMNQGSPGHSLLVKNGSLVAVGGKEGCVEEYDVVNDIWSVKEEYKDEKPIGGFVMFKYYLGSE